MKKKEISAKQGRKGETATVSVHVIRPQVLNNPDKTAL